MANSYVTSDSERRALIDDIRMDEPIDEWLQDEDRGLLSMGDSAGWTPLIFAAYYDNTRAAKLLLEAGVDVDQRTRQGETPLLLACDRGHVESVELLLSAGASVDFADGRGQTALYFACGHGHAECARLLLSAGASVDLANFVGQTALRFASGSEWAGSVECVELLLSAGASVDLADVHGVTPLDIACCEGHIQCVQLFFSYATNRNSQQYTEHLLQSLISGHFALTNWLALSCEWSPLHHLEVLSSERTRALLRGGAELHLTPSAGDTATPLERARQLAPASASASLVVRAAGPWSTTSHELFGDAERARAVTLAHSLYHVYLRRMEHGGWQAVDFAHHVLSHLLCR
jgi:ankyrin repeat protein